MRTKVLIVARPRFCLLELFIARPAILLPLVTPLPRFQKTNQNNLFHRPGHWVLVVGGRGSLLERSCPLSISEFGAGSVHVGALFFVAAQFRCCGDGSIGLTNRIELDARGENRVSRIVLKLSR